MQLRIILVITFFLCCRQSHSQDPRLSDHNHIGWLSYTGTFKVYPRIAIHTEAQWRRTDLLNNPQQLLIRTGVNYLLRKDISLNAGYAFAETYPYGEYPASYIFPEHRFYEQIVLQNPVGKVSISHRFTLEQRFLERQSILNGEKIKNWIYMNRGRYRVRAEVPLKKKNPETNLWSIILQDELFIGWGKNVGANIFDQNRLGILIGYKVNRSIKLEAGYLNQTLQQAKRINGQAVFQYNNGVMLATHISLDLIKK